MFKSFLFPFSNRMLEQKEVGGKSVWKWNLSNGLHSSYHFCDVCICNIFPFLHTHTIYYNAAAPKFCGQNSPSKFGLIMHWPLLLWEVLDCSLPQITVILGRWCWDTTCFFSMHNNYGYPKLTILKLIPFKLKFVTNHAVDTQTPKHASSFQCSGSWVYRSRVVWTACNGKHVIDAWIDWIFV